MYPVSYTHLYLQPVEVKPGRQSLDLGDNDDFDSFIRSRDVTAYDSSYAMFRWETDISSDMVSAQINGAGTVTDMTVTGRGAGGIASELSVSGSDGTVTVSYTHLPKGVCAETPAGTAGEDSGSVPCATGPPWRKQQPG